MSLAAILIIVGIILVLIDAALGWAPAAGTSNRPAYRGVLLHLGVILVGVGVLVPLIGH